MGQLSGLNHPPQPPHHQPHQLVQPVDQVPITTDQVKRATPVILAVTFVSVLGFVVELLSRFQNTYHELGRAVTAVPLAHDATTCSSDPLTIPPVLQV